MTWEHKIRLFREAGRIQKGSTSRSLIGLGCTAGSSTPNHDKATVARDQIFTGPIKKKKKKDSKFKISIFKTIKMYYLGSGHQVPAISGTLQSVQMKRT
jgi:hypothetical protein